MVRAVLMMFGGVVAAVGNPLIMALLVLLSLSSMLLLLPKSGGVGAFAEAAEGTGVEHAKNKR
jgi:hypothetical protein